MDEKVNKEFHRWGKTPPSHEPHGTPDDIAKNMRRLLPDKWTLEGNLLKGMTEIGELAQRIPTDVILTGTKDGLPVFEKVVIQ